MFLYELALELDVRSTALMDRAHAMGMQVDATAQLTPEQVQALRTAYGRGRAPLTDPQYLQPGSGAPTDGDGGLNPPAIAALVAAALVVVLLVGYMVTNSGNDTAAVGAGNTNVAPESSTTTTEPCDADSGIGVGAIGQDTPTTAAGDAGPETSAAPAPDAAGEVLPPCDVVGGLSGDEIAAASTTFDGDPLDLPRDKREFCKAALSIFDFEMRLAESANLDEIGPIRDVMLSGRDQFKADLEQLRATAPPRIDGPLDRYAVVYTNLLDSANAGGDDYTLALAFLQASRTDLAYYANQINTAVTENCDKR